LCTGVVQLPLADGLLRDERRVAGDVVLGLGEPRLSGCLVGFRRGDGRFERLAIDVIERRAGANERAFLEVDSLEKAFDASADFDVLGASDDDVAGTIVYRAPTGTSTVSVSFLAEEYSIAGVSRCQFAGTAVAAQ